MTSADVALGEFSLELFVRRRDDMDSVTRRRLESIKDSEWLSLFGTFVVLDALRAGDLRGDELLAAIRLAEQGQFAESSEHVLSKLMTVALQE